MNTSTNIHCLKSVVVVVLYNEDPLPFLFNQIDVPVILVDNTPGRNLNIKKPNVVYLPLNSNYGIAKALNVGINYANKLGADWVLTLDQDSVLPENLFFEFEKYIPKLEKPAILAPQLNMYDGENKKTSDTYNVITEALTSGSFINMKAFIEAGGYKEKMFIDGVDFELCMHVRLLGYNIYQINSVVMQHHLGQSREYKLFGRHLFYVTHHNHIRHYYMQRNTLLLAKLYYGLLPEVKSRHPFPFICVLKILLFENNKIKKLRARYKGYLDFKNNVFGEYTGL